MLVTTRTNTKGTRTRRLLAAMTLLLAITVPVFVQGQEQNNSSHEMKVPETAKDHYDMAEHYQKVAAQTREDVEMHKKMLADFTKSVAANPKSGENPYAKNMRLHCERYIKAAEELAAEADGLPSFIPFVRRSWRANKLSSATGRSSQPTGTLLPIWITGSTSGWTREFAK